MAKIFAGNIEMPMLDEKLELFHQVGAVLAAKYDGRFYNFIKSCSPKLYDNGKGLVERLAAEFPRFNDISEYDGHSIKIYKLTQLGYWQIYSGLHGTGAFKLEDPQMMTAFADYIVPVGLRRHGDDQLFARVGEGDQYVPDDSARFEMGDRDPGTLPVCDSAARG